MQNRESKKVNRFIFILYRPYFKLRYWLSWKVLIRTCLEVYLEIFLSTIVILVKFPWSDDSNDRLNCIYAVLYGILLISFPVYMAYFYHKHRDRLYDTTFRAKYGGGYDGIKSPMNQDSELKFRRRSATVSILMPLIFIGRRISFCFTIVFIDGLSIPLILHFWSMWIIIEVLISADPYERKRDKYIDIFNESILVILMCILLGFTSWMPIADFGDNEFKYYLGWVFVSIVFFHIFLHFVLIIRESFKNTEKYTKETVKKNKDMRQRKKNIEIALR